jgi:hypothetical protein
MQWGKIYEYAKMICMTGSQILPRRPLGGGGSGFTYVGTKRQNCGRRALE